MKGYKKYISLGTFTADEERHLDAQFQELRKDKRPLDLVELTTQFGPLYVYAGASFRDAWFPNWTGKEIGYRA